MGVDEKGVEAGSRVRRDRKAWQALMRRYEASGQSQVAFCRRHGIALSSFARWRQLLICDAAAIERPASAGVCATAPMFMEVQRPEVAVASSGWEIELQLGDGVLLRLRRAC